jgi:hypothetical protein
MTTSVIVEDAVLQRIRRPENVGLRLRDGRTGRGHHGNDTEANRAIKKLDRWGDSPPPFFAALTSGVNHPAVRTRQSLTFG